VGTRTLAERKCGSLLSFHDHAGNGFSERSLLSGCTAVSGGAAVGPRHEVGSEPVIRCWREDGPATGHGGGEVLYGGRGSGRRANIRRGGKVAIKTRFKGGFGRARGTASQTSAQDLWGVGSIHANIARLLDWRARPKAECHKLVMELIEGDDRRLLQRQPGFSVEKRLAIGFCGFATQ